MRCLIQIFIIALENNVFTQRRGKLYNFPGVLKGLRHVRMDIHTPIPSFLRFGRFLLRVYYDDQPKACRICNSLDHLSRDCDNVVCFNCESPESAPRICDVAFARKKTIWRLIVHTLGVYARPHIGRRAGDPGGFRARCGS